jgi:hypothetical protein
MTAGLPARAAPALNASRRVTHQEPPLPRSTIATSLRLAACSAPTICIGEESGTMLPGMPTLSGIRNPAAAGGAARPKSILTPRMSTTAPRVEKKSSTTSVSGTAPANRTAQLWTASTPGPGQPESCCAIASTTNNAIQIPGSASSAATTE